MNTFRPFALFMLALSFAVAVPHALAVGESVVTTSLTPLGAISPGTSVSFATMANGFTDPRYSVTDAFTYSGATVGTIDKIGNFYWTPTLYDAGHHTITVAVADDYQHAASTTVNIIVASTAIIVKDVAPGPTIAAGRTVTFNVLAPGFLSPTFSVYDTSGMSSLTLNNINSSGVFSWTPGPDDVGTHVLSVRASDPYGNFATAPQTITVINPNISVQSLKPGSAAGVGSTVSFLATAGFLVNPTYTVSDIFTGTSTITTNNISSTGAFSWRPTAADLGLHSLTVVATDKYKNAGTTTLMIAVTNAPPTVDTPASPTVVTTNAISTPVVSATTKFQFKTALGLGSRGTAVTELQNRLISLGYLSGSSTGYYGALTVGAVKKFQKAHGLSQLGSVGPGTRAALNTN